MIPHEFEKENAYFNAIVEEYIRKTPMPTLSNNNRPTHARKDHDNLTNNLMTITPPPPQKYPNRKMKYGRGS